MVDYSGSAATFSFDKIIFRVDNTTPNIKIMTPQASEQVLKRINISAITSDIHLNSYRVDSSTDQEGKSWEPIYLQAGLYQKSEDALLPKPKLKTAKINRDWEIPILESPVWIWLTATNIAGNTHSRTIQVEAPTHCSNPKRRHHFSPRSASGTLLSTQYTGTRRNCDRQCHNQSRGWTASSSNQLGL